MRRANRSLSPEFQRIGTSKLIRLKGVSDQGPLFGLDPHQSPLDLVTIVQRDKSSFLKTVVIIIIMCRGIGVIG